jgi:glycosyltransferase involved in cell wall biosynthesis
VRELIYVDSASTDGSPEAASRMGAKVTVVHPARPTAAIGRNAGWRQATQELVLFLDGDTVLHPDFLHAAAEILLTQPEIAAVWGHRREIHPETSIYNRVLDLDWVYQPGPSEFFGGDVLVRRRILEATQGFNETLIAGEEPELCRRIRGLGATILHVDRPMTGHDLRIYRFRQYWLRATRAGHAYAEVSERFRRTSDPFWTAESRANLKRGGFWLVSPLAALALSLAWQPWPLLAWISLFALLTVRTARKARWKGGSPWTLLAYAVHSQFQQIPILWGQLEYRLGRRLKHSRGLIEYKETAAK